MNSHRCADNLSRSFVFDLFSSASSALIFSLASTGIMIPRKTKSPSLYVTGFLQSSDASYFVRPASAPECSFVYAACAAASLAVSTRNGEHDT